MIAIDDPCVPSLRKHVMHACWNTEISLIGCDRSVWSYRPICEGYWQVGWQSGPSCDDEPHSRNAKAEVEW